MNSVCTERRGTLAKTHRSLLDRRLWSARSSRQHCVCRGSASTWATTACRVLRAVSHDDSTDHSDSTGPPHCLSQGPLSPSQHCSTTLFIAGSTVSISTSRLHLVYRSVHCLRLNTASPLCLSLGPLSPYQHRATALSIAGSVVSISILPLNEPINITAVLQRAN